MGDTLGIPARLLHIPTADDCPEISRFLHPSVRYPAIVIGKLRILKVADLSDCVRRAARENDLSEPPQLLRLSEETPEHSMAPKMVIRKIWRQRRDALNADKPSSAKKRDDDSDNDGTSDEEFDLGAQSRRNHVVTNLNGAGEF